MFFKGNMSCEDCSEIMNKSLRTIQRWCEKNNVYKGADGYVVDSATLRKMHRYYYGVGNIISNTPEKLIRKLQRDLNSEERNYQSIISLTTFEFDDVIIKNNMLYESNNFNEVVHFQAVKSTKENRVCLKFDYGKTYWKSHNWSFDYSSLVERKQLLSKLESEIYEGVYFDKLNESLLFLMEQKIHTVVSEYQKTVSELNRYKSMLESYRLAARIEDDSKNDYRFKPSKTYIMKDLSTGLYKIGKSKNPEYRERTLQSEKPTIKMIKVFESDIESNLHQEFSDLRVRGEWFKLNKVQLKRICTQYE